MLLLGKSIDSNLFYQQLMELNKGIDKKRAELINRKGLMTNGNIW